MVFTPCDRWAANGADPLVSQQSVKNGPADASCTDLQEECAQMERRWNYLFDWKDEAVASSSFSTDTLRSPGRVMPVPHRRSGDSRGEFHIKRTHPTSDTCAGGMHPQTNQMAAGDTRRHLNKQKQLNTEPTNQIRIMAIITTSTLAQEKDLTGIHGGTDDEMRATFVFLNASRKRIRSTQRGDHQ